MSNFFFNPSAAIDSDKLRLRPHRINLPACKLPNPDMTMAKRNAISDIFQSSTAAQENFPGSFEYWSCGHGYYCIRIKQSTTKRQLISILYLIPFRHGNRKIFCIDMFLSLHDRISTTLKESRPFFFQALLPPVTVS